MKNFKRKYIVDEEGKKKYVVLSMSIFKMIMSELEDYDDLQLAIRAKKRKNVKFIPLEEAMKEHTKEKNKQKKDV